MSLAAPFSLSSSPAPFFSPLHLLLSLHFSLLVMVLVLFLLLFLSQFSWASYSEYTVESNNTGPRSQHLLSQLCNLWRPIPAPPEPTPAVGQSRAEQLSPALLGEASALQHEKDERKRMAFQTLFPSKFAVEGSAHQGGSELGRAELEEGEASTGHWGTLPLRP